MTGLDVCLACDLEPRPPTRRFLVDELWGDRAVGIVGGEPKCCKSFLALDMALSVASGRPCLRRFAVNDPGPVLLFAAENALCVVRERLDGIARAAQTTLRGLPLHVITAPTVRLDVTRDRDALRTTVEIIRPRLLVLDPFVRLHRVNENSADDVAPLLAYLRELQRTYDVAVLLVHHARKGGHVRAGQALRGSSEFHAWGDSNLYLRRDRDRLRLTIEHRAASSLPTMTLELASQDDGLALQLQDAENQPEAEPAGPSHEQRVLEILDNAEAPMTRRALRDACRMRSQALGDALESLVSAGRVVRGSDGFLRS